jgi:hypothetical protein
MEATPPAIARTLDAALAIGSAAVIAYGVLVLGWSVFTVMALFWFENVVVGAFNVLRMLVSGERMGITGVLAALFMAAFFTVHYGLFTAVHGVFVVVLFGTAELGREAMNGGLAGPLGRMLEALVSNREGWLALLAIVAVHTAGFAQWVFASRERPTPLNELMGAPYGRIMVLHVTLIAGGFLVTSLQAPALGVLLLIALKLGYDLRALRRAAPADPERAAAGAPSGLLAAGRRTLR